MASFTEPPFTGQIFAKYFFKLYHQKIFAVSFKSYIQLVLKIHSYPSSILLELKLILLQILLLQWAVFN